MGFLSPNASKPTFLGIFNRHLIRKLLTVYAVFVFYYYMAFNLAHPHYGNIYEHELETFIPRIIDSCVRDEANCHHKSGVIAASLVSMSHIFACDKESSASRSISEELDKLADEIFECKTSGCVYRFYDQHENFYKEIGMEVDRMYYQKTELKSCFDENAFAVFHK
uniref:DUF19 domain-containing protein n=1 Tax=Caenorhabditis tropicalis TaxID=1561998 RepID=A0A1I7SXQ7_9PELO